MIDAPPRPADDRLRESEARFRALATAGAFMLYRMSPDWRLMWELSGRDVLADTLEPTESWADLYLLDEDRPEILAAINEAIRTKALFEREHRVRRADGGVAWVRSRAVPILTEGGEIVEWFGAATDISEGREAQDRLRDAASRHRTDLEHQVRERTAELQASRDLLQAIIDSSTDMIQVFEAVHDEAGEIADFCWILNNETSEKLYGKIDGQSLLERNPGVVVEGIFDDFKRVANTGVPIQKERHYAHEQYDGCFYQSVVKLGNGVATTTTDIGALKQAQQDVLALQDEVAQVKLRESEDRFRTLAESIDDVFYMTDLERGTLLYLSPSYERIWGRPVAELMANLSLFERSLHPDDLPKFRVDLATQHRGEPVTTEYRIMRPDGSERLILDRSFPVAGKEAKLSAGVASDITERRKADDARAETEARLRTLVNGIPQLVWRAGERAGWTWASPQWTSFTGQSCEASLGLGWLDMVHPDDREGALADWAKARDQDTYTAEYRVHRADGTGYCWFQTRALSVRERGGRVIEWLGTSTDIDELRSLQSRQQLLLAELQHRVRNTLGVIKSVARRTAESSDDVEELAAHLDGRIEAFARVQAAVTRDPLAGVSLTSLVEDELLAHAARDGRQVQIKGPGMLLQPRAAESMSLAIHELATNAVKHGALSARSGRIAISWQVESDAFRFEWKEFGIDRDLQSPTGEGFGLELLLRSLPYDLDAETRADFEPSGLRFTMRAPAKALLKQAFAPTA